MTLLPVDLGFPLNELQTRRGHFIPKLPLTSGWINTCTYTNKEWGGLTPTHRNTHIAYAPCGPVGPCQEGVSPLPPWVSLSLLTGPQQTTSAPDRPPTDPHTPRWASAGISSSPTGGGNVSPEERIGWD